MQAAAGRLCEKNVTIHGQSGYAYGCAMLAWKQTKAYSDKTCEAGTAPSASGKSIADATYVLCTDGLWLDGWRGRE